MSSTNFAYAVIGIRTPVTHLFTAGDDYQACRNHGIQKGKHCSECGTSLNRRWAQVATPAMIKAAKHYGVKPLPLWDMMGNKRDSHNNPAPLGWWTTRYGLVYQDVTDEDDVVLGLHLIHTPFVDPGGAYPVAAVDIDRLLRISREVEEHLTNFDLLGKPALYVFAYC